MKSMKQKGRALVFKPKLEKMSVFHQTHDILTYKPSVDSDLTIRTVQKIPDIQSPSLYEYLTSKIANSYKLLYDERISARSLVAKHQFSLEKRISNICEMFQILQELHNEEKYELQAQLNEILMYQSYLMEIYQRYETKLVRIVELEKTFEEQTTKKIPKFLELSTTSEKSKISIQQSQKVMLFVDNYDDQKITHSVKILNQSVKKQMALSRSTLIHDKQKERELILQKVQNLPLKIDYSKKRQEDFQTNIKISKKQNQRTVSEISPIKKISKQLHNQIQNLFSQLQNIKCQNKNIDNQLQKLRLAYLLIVSPIQKLYLIKKSLNNQLQELRGSIRVYCRIRPLKLNQNPMTYELKSHDFINIKKNLQEKSSQNTKRDFKFVFDRIFDQKTSQQQVFSEISQLIQTAIDGVNVCIFAYGQTGSGKTFTMQGNADKGKQNLGLIPKSTELIFSELQKYQQNGWKTSLDVSINQIYNDSVINLLEKSQIKMSKPIFTSIPSIKEVEELFNKAISNRSTAFTLSNADSSRSHLIFIIRIQSKSPKNQQNKFQERQSQLVLVDLAGSQRVKESGVSKERLKEAQHINSSLSQLGQVIRSLKNNKGKTNFRNSKLTYFLEPYLQKGSKAIMFVNMSPSVSDESQSINSLKFASTARECKLQAD